jgi:predicted acyltransferase
VERLTSLDVFRGLTVAAMILVTDPGLYSAVYPQLLHAQWAGVTATDMIFPSFLVMTGVAMTLSFTARLQKGATPAQLWWHVLRRSVIIFLLGLLLNGFPEYHWQTIRIPGVLQRIALCYLLGALVYLATRGRIAALAAVTLVLLAGYWMAITLVPVPGFGPGRLDSNGNLGAYLDRAIFGVRHLWPWGLTPGAGVTFDPEGLLSSLPALATLLMGVLGGEWIRGEQAPIRRAAGLAIGGAILMAAGLAATPFMPLIKKIWTPSFALFSGGFALVAFALFYWLTDIRKWRAWTRPALVFGANAIVAFVVSTVITVLADRIHIGAVTLHEWGYRTLFTTWLPPVDASLAWALTIVLLNLAVLYPLYRRRIFLRV